MSHTSEAAMRRLAPRPLAKAERCSTPRCALPVSQHCERCTAALCRSCTTIVPEGRAAAFVCAACAQDPQPSSVRPAPKKTPHERCAEPGCAALLVPERGDFAPTAYHCDGCDVPLCDKHSEPFETKQGGIVLCSRCAKGAA